MSMRGITLRTDGEIDWDEGAAVKDAGLEFITIPLRRPDSLTDDVFDRVRRLIPLLVAGMSWDGQIGFWDGLLVTRA